MFSLQDLHVQGQLYYLMHFISQIFCISLMQICHLSRPNWSKISFNKRVLELKETHGDGIKVSTESPEAFEEVFWQTFADEEEKN